jgi:NAD(P)-dependent dehydrogenase (short-subunit alcohol dehydrogenase family)
MPAAGRTWFITGASRGFGREWTRAALARGERVAATVRDAGALDDLAAEHGDALQVLALDVRDRQGCFDAVRAAHERFGRLDVVVNNAGYLHQGMIEELTEQEVRDQLETNLLGPLWVTQAALPFLRAQGSGHLLQVSSVGGVFAFPMVGLYNTSKWGLEGMSEALAAEVAPFGIRVTIIEPGGFATDALASMRASEPLDAYAPVYEMARERQRGRRVTLGDPAASAEAILRIVDAEEPPLRVFFGGRWIEDATAVYERRLAGWRAQQPLAELSEGSG